MVQEKDVKRAKAKGTRKCNIQRWLYWTLRKKYNTMQWEEGNKKNMSNNNVIKKSYTSKTKRKLMEKLMKMLENRAIKAEGKKYDANSWGVAEEGKTVKG